MSEMLFFVKALKLEKCSWNVVSICGYQTTLSTSRRKFLSANVQMIMPAETRSPDETSGVINTLDSAYTAYTRLVSPTSAC